MQSPIEIFLKWYNSIPADHGEDIAFRIRNFVPGFHDIEMFGDISMSTQLKERLEEFVENECRNAGVIVAIRAIIEFRYMNHRATENDWVVTRHNLEGMRDFCLEKGDVDLVGHFTQSLEEMPESQEGWIKTCDAWKEVAKVALSDENIDAWLEITMNEKLARKKKGGELDSWKFLP
ncbi:MAG: hypothetical protein RBU21_08725 [FCB group bacterium]|jgi:hypothetical protein|nr:hypothetical protein [FCB group bacterium]